MKLIKKINNNFALAIDSQGEEVIVSGKGVGFTQMPCELENLGLISRTYYDIDERYIGLLNQVPEEIIEVSVNIVDYAKTKLKTKLNANIIFTLADHIHFSITRLEKGIVFDFPLTYDFEQAYEIEILVGEYALKLIKKRLGVTLPQAEIMGIAMNIINSELFPSLANDEKDYESLIKNITLIVEKHFEIKVDRKTVNYSRFATHLRYLFKRISQQKTISSDNLRIFESLKNETPKASECVNRISYYLKRNKNWDIDKEELLYLILHVNRLLERTVTERA